MPIRHGLSRSGFTLIELLMVLIIVGVLAGLLLMAVTGGLGKGKTAQVVAEIDQLSTAIETYRTDRGSYPPTVGYFIGDIPSGSALSVNQQRIWRHILKAFPRYTGGYMNTSTSTTPSFRDDVALATQLVVAYSGGNIKASLTAKALYSTANGNGLDVNNLDPAESLVFWLGGIPDPTTETKLAGFNSDLSSPFVPAVARSTGNDPSGNAIQSVSPSQQGNGQRTQRMYNFDPRRLVDYDQDGWWEYLPAGGTTDAQTPPFAYFDYGSYATKTIAPAYPFPYTAASSLSITMSFAMGPSSTQWGNTYPYVADPPNVTPIKFVNSQKYQIIAAGQDNQYADPISSIPWINSANAAASWLFKLEYFPSGTNYDTQDRDNLTNFAKGPLSDEIPQ